MKGSENFLEGCQSSARERRLVIRSCLGLLVKGSIILMSGLCCCGHPKATSSSPLRHPEPSPSGTPRRGHELSYSESTSGLSTDSFSGSEDVRVTPFCAGSGSTLHLPSKCSCRYSLEELSRHKEMGNVWIRMGKKVYDVSGWVHRHPGGASAIINHAGGEDCKPHYAFHRKSSRKLWDQFYIGRVLKE